jgi:hypothetical protein
MPAAVGPTKLNFVESARSVLVNVWLGDTAD